MISADSSTGTWQGRYVNNAGSAVDVDSGVSIVAGAWTHIAMIQDNCDINFYVNGILKSHLTNAGVASFSSASFADIGAYDYGGDNMVAFFDGLIDDMRIYDHVLSEGDIRAVMPEPATVLLLGLGGLMLRRKR